MRGPFEARVPFSHTRCVVAQLFCTRHRLLEKVYPVTETLILITTSPVLEDFFCPSPRKSELLMLLELYRYKILAFQYREKAGRLGDPVYIFISVTVMSKHFAYFFHIQKVI